MDIDTALPAVIPNNSIMLLQEVLRNHFKDTLFILKRFYTENNNNKNPDVLRNLLRMKIFNKIASSLRNLHYKIFFT